MSALFESIKQGLGEAIEYERGHLPNVRVDKISIAPLHPYNGDEIKELRLRHNMSQRLFAQALGVSTKTVEAWEAGINTPSGIANRMLELLNHDSTLLERCSIVARH